MKSKMQKSFRPQQGLPIMNKTKHVASENLLEKESFRPQQGLPIMNGRQNCLYD